ncbi:protein S-acyltransferase 11-like isoform X1 [Chenopodium quinoa]|uniref:S-acyltransferase n=1 Tax=Chenopodium quinoa TaxID=63459 RepID=A0A803LRU1_CHEQI|nr:protein S-acyltransferase 11-like isoform X1 [Chenopodium quinoa]
MAAINVQRSPSPPPLEESNNGFLSQSLASTSPPSSQTLEQYPSSMEHDYESICWGCGLRLILPSNAPVFKCGWCGAITKQNESRREGKKLRWRRLRDRCFVSILLVFVSFVICGGLWAVYPVIFSVSLFCGVFHSIVTFLLSVSTVSMFGLAAITDAGTPSPVVWGSYPAVRKDELQDYTFCQYCSKPKSPRAHHCSSCGSCVLDMDHHCPFIGNCVGAGNHRYFIGFLIVAVISVTYAAIMSAYAILHVLPSVGEGSFQEMHGLNSNIAFMGILKDIFIAFVTSAVFFSPRGLVLLYLFVASISVGIGLTVLLWQQLYFIYEGRTYLTSLSSQDDAERDCRNLYRFFGFPHSFSLYFRVCCNSKKIHRKL